jgi:hypothetical protein
MGPRPIRNLHPYLAADIHDPAGPYMLKSPETKKALLGGPNRLPVRQSQYRRRRILRKAPRGVKARFSRNFDRQCAAPGYMDVRIDQSSGKKRNSKALDR